MPFMLIMAPLRNGVADVSEATPARRKLAERKRFNESAVSGSLQQINAGSGHLPAQSLLENSIKKAAIRKKG